MAVTRQKVRDWVVYTYMTLPVSVNVTKSRVDVVIPAADVRRFGLDLERMSQTLAAFVGRDAEVKST